MTKFGPPSMPSVQAKHQGGKQKPTAIILRPTFTHSREGAALAVAQVWHKEEGNFWSAGHYTVDSTKRFRCVRDNRIAGRYNQDRGIIRVAICAEPHSATTFWHPETHADVLNKTAELVAELTLAYNINLKFLNLEEIERWQKRPWRRRGGIIIDKVYRLDERVFLEDVIAHRAGLRAST